MEYALLCNFGEKHKVGDTSPIPPSIKVGDTSPIPLKMITKHNKNNNVYTVYLLLNSL
jgi:hypothetical protein